MDRKDAAVAWRSIRASVTGPSHEKIGTPCQDSHLVCVQGGEETPSIIVCVADGAGSSEYSDEGSATACQTVAEMATLFFEKHRSFGNLTEEEVLAWCNKIRERLRHLAEDRESTLREFATTLCVALLSPSGSVFFQIGDGAIVARRTESFGVVFWPQSGEYANTTMFLTGDNYEDHFQFHAEEGDFVDVALMTDGVERLALSFEGQNPHAPFFEPLFGALHSAADPDALNQDLRQFLDSDSMKVRSDDDKTVVLATKSSV